MGNLWDAPDNPQGCLISGFIVGAGMELYVVAAPEERMLWVGPCATPSAVIYRSLLIIITPYFLASRSLLQLDCRCMQNCSSKPGKLDSECRDLEGRLAMRLTRFVLALALAVILPFSCRLEGCWPIF